MNEYEAAIIRIERRYGGITILTLSCPQIAEQAKPGQFVQVRAGLTTDPFLRRTFSIADVDSAEGRITLMVDVIGPGTSLLCTEPRGRTVDVIGPLGSGFTIEQRQEGKGPLLIGGGIGIAPLRFLAGQLNSIYHCSIRFLFGAKTGELLPSYGADILDVDEFHIATDDGSAGYHGFVSQLLEKQLPKMDGISRAYVCGPSPMMRECARILLGHGVQCEVSFEERMACGLGACYGCAVKMADGSMRRSCVDGPVMDASLVDWEGA